MRENGIENDDIIDLREENKSEKTEENKAEINTSEAPVTGNESDATAVGENDTAFGVSGEIAADEEKCGESACAPEEKNTAGNIKANSTSPDSADVSVSNPTVSSVYRPPYTAPVISAPDGSALNNAGVASLKFNYETEQIQTSRKIARKDVSHRRKNVSLLSAAVCVLLAICVGLGSGWYFSSNLAKNLSMKLDSVSANLEEIENRAVIYKNSAVEVIDANLQNKYSKQGVFELVSDSVVLINTKKSGGSYSAGSGVIYAKSSSAGYIVTNQHVVEGAEQIQITLSNGNRYNATYLDGDASMDIAVIKIETTDKLNPAIIGSSENLHVGDEILAIGNPLGYGITATEGIISAVDKKATVGGYQMVLLQISAAVNPGNSGGGLFNMTGELVGIVNAKYAAEGIEGIGFSIPIDNVYDSILQIIKNGYIGGRKTLNIQIEYISNSINSYYKYGNYSTGVYVAGSSNPLFLKNDMILSIGSAIIKTDSDYYAALKDTEIGETVEVKVLRNGRTITVNATIEEYVPEKVKS